MKAIVYAAIALVFLFLIAIVAPPAHAFEMKDGKMVLLPQEQIVLDKCVAAGGGCFIVSREIVQAYAQNYADSQVAELQAEVAARFGQAVADEAKAVAAKICKNTI